MEAAQEAMQSVESGTNHAHVPEPKLQLLAQAVERILRSGTAEEYKVYICEGNNKPYPTSAPRTAATVFTSTGSTGRRRVVNFWCFSTGVALKELVSLGVRSVVITSGTLSPLDTLKDDFKIPFSIELQNPHIISPQQILVSAVAQGMNRQTLNSSYHHRDTSSYKVNQSFTYNQQQQQFINE